MKTLVIVDVQKDFFNPDGSLYVAGGEMLPEKIAAEAANADRVVFTLDWHPADHCSFKAQGGIWPEHCVQYTAGAGLADAFTPILKRKGEFALHFKGCDKAREQYGAFEEVDGLISAWFDESDVIEVCGIAGDYCVKESAANLLRHAGWAAKTRIREDLTASIDDGSTLKAFINENHLI